MSFCANCGRQRDGTTRFCAGCGTEFADAASPAEPTAGRKAGPGTASSGDPSGPEGATRTDVPADVTRADPPDPFASWYQPPPQGAQSDDGNWQPTQTVEAAPARRGGYQPPPAGPVPPGPQAGGPYPGGPYPGGPYPGAPYPGSPPAGGREPRSRRGLFAALAIIVVLAAGGGAYALATTLGGHHAAQSPTQPSTGTSATTGPSASAPAGSPAASPSATPSATLSLVALAPGVSGNAAAPQVESLLSHYFHGINTRDYGEYASTLTPAEKARQTQSVFTSGYSTTTDSGMTVTTLTSGSNGLTATVTFTSRQAQAQSVDHSSCNDWTLNFYLVPQGGGYLIGPEPSGYQPDHSDC
jgi:hypothetical protein